MRPEVDPQTANTIMDEVRNWPNEKECPKCRKEFHSKQGRDRHVASVHLNQRSHKCETCGKTFKGVCALPSSRKNVG